MSAVKKAAKTSLFIFSFLVLIFVGGAIYFYMNMNDIAKQLTEKMASDALGVSVKLGAMDINLEELKVVVSDIRVANPKGYKKPYALRIDEVVIAAESFTPDLLTFSRINVEGTNVNLEVGLNGTNLGDLNKNIAAKGQGANFSPKSPEEEMKVIVKKLSLTKAQLNPSVILLDKDVAFIVVPDIHINGIGERENGVLAGDAIAQIMKVVFQKFNKSAGSAGFLEGLSLEALNQIGVSTVDVFKKNLKESFNNDVGELKKGLKGLLGK